MTVTCNLLFFFLRTDYRIVAAFAQPDNLTADLLTFFYPFVLLRGKNWFVLE